MLILAIIPSAALVSTMIPALLLFRQSHYELQALPCS
jgi:hypothetical protein